MVNLGKTEMSYSSFRFRYWLFASVICIVVLLMLVEETQCRGRGGGGGRRGGGGVSSRGRSQGGNKWSNSPSKNHKYKSKSYGSNKYKKGAIAAGVLLVPSLALYSSRRRYSTSRSIPSTSSSYIYYEASELPDAFNVSNNDHYTPFMLVLEEDVMFKCLTVPKDATIQKCPQIFKEYVKVDTDFKIPQNISTDYNRTIKPTSEIALCCNSNALVPTSLTMLVLYIFAFSFTI